MAVAPIPPGYASVTPYLVVSGAAKAIDFYQRAFGAVELFRLDSPDGTIGHAEIKIGNSPVMLADSMGGFPDPFGHVWSLSTHVEDVSPEEMDRRFQQLMNPAAGA